MSVASDVKGDVYALGVADAGIHFVLEPILRHLLLDHSDVPRITIAEVTAAAGEAKSAFCAACAESTVRPADGTAFPKRNDVTRFFDGFFFGLSGGCGRRGGFFFFFGPHWDAGPALFF